MCIYMNGSELNRTHHVKYLGIIIDDRLNWIQHITYVKNKISKGIGIMYKARTYLSKKCMSNLYHTFIYPYLIYCIEVWGNAPKCHLNPILLLQKKIIRIITYSHYIAHTENIFKELHILPIDKVYVSRVGIFMYKQEHGLLPEVMDSLYIKTNAIHFHNTRNANKFRISTGTETFSHISARIWNALESKIDVSVSLKKFKISLNTFLQNNTLNIKYTK